MTARPSRLAAVALAVIVLGAALLPAPTLSAEDSWVRTTEATVVWAGPDRDSAAFGRVPRLTYFRQQGAVGERLAVLDPRRGRTVYLDADSVEPSGPPPDEYLDLQARLGGAIGETEARFSASLAPRKVLLAGPVADPAFSAFWVQAAGPATLWTAVDDAAAPLGTLEPGSYLKVVGPGNGARMVVHEPISGGIAYADAGALEAKSEPDTSTLLPVGWRGYVGAESAYIRDAPSTAGEVVAEVPLGTPVAVAAWVAGEEVLADQPGWAQLAERTYVYGPLLRRAILPRAPPLPEGLEPPAGRWLDVNLTLQQITAYEGDSPVATLPVSTGRPEWETPLGTFEVLWRVENETMESTTLGGAESERATYKVENVRWTQYFLWDGTAIHENYWRDPALFGIPSSHGCLGIRSQDAEWLWHFAEVGTPLIIHD